MKKSHSTRSGAEQASLYPLEAVMAFTHSVRAAGRAVSSPFRLAMRAKRDRKAKKAAKAEAQAALRFSRLAPRLRRDVIRTRRRLYDL